MARPTADVALVLKVHPSNYRVEGFVEDTPVAALAGLAVPVVADIGSGLVDAACPWLPDGPPLWLDGEPAARQTLAAGAALVTFSGDKLLGGPQAGVIAGRADLVAACAAHPLARALRPGGLVLASLQDVLLAYLRRDVSERVPFWRMVTTPVATLRCSGRGHPRPARSRSGTWRIGVDGRTAGRRCPGRARSPAPSSPPTAWSSPAITPPRCAEPCRRSSPASSDRCTLLDLRTVSPSDDDHAARGSWPPSSAGEPVRVVATAGHVDHGKSSLVFALTGTDPDRFAEEKRRGLTIDLGFAHTVLPSGEGVSFVDVPGHVRFLGNMLAGVGGVDACLFVVAATEGWKPQSEEHLRILELVGVGHGVVALTKADAVDADTVELARLDVADHVTGTFLAQAPVVPVSAVTAHGLDGPAIGAGRPGGGDTISGRSSPTPAVGGSRLRGQGQRHRGDRDADRRLVGGGRRARRRRGGTTGPGPRHPDARPGRRAHRAGQPRRPEPGRGRAPSPAPRRRRRRTGALATDRPASTPSLGVLAEPGPRGDPARRLRRVHRFRGAPGAGAGRRCASDPARRDGRDPPAPDHARAGPARATGTCCASRAEARPWAAAWCSTWPRPGRRRRLEPASAWTGAADRVWPTEVGSLADELEALTGERRTPDLGRWVAAPGAHRHDGRSGAPARFAAAGPLGLDVASLDEREREALTRMDGVEVAGGRARPASAPDPLDDHPFSPALEAGRARPAAARRRRPRAVLRELVPARPGGRARRRLLRAVAPSTPRPATAARLLAATPDGFTVAELREALGITRKHALPLVNELDARGITRRRGDQRVARAPSARAVEAWRGGPSRWRRGSAGRTAAASGRAAGGAVPPPPTAAYDSPPARGPAWRPRGRW